MSSNHAGGSGEPEDAQVEEWLECLDGRGSEREHAAVARLRGLGSRLPTLLLQHYLRSRDRSVRCACVFYAIRCARESDDAVALGLKAIEDRSKVVRYRGAMLLACAGHREVIPRLQAVIDRLGNDPSTEDLRASIDALEHGNHNFFLDRDHSGKVFLELG